MNCEELPSKRLRFDKPAISVHCHSYADLPQDVLVQIFSSLSTQELYQSCILTCKRWAAVLKSLSLFETTIKREFQDKKVDFDSLLKSYPDFFAKFAKFLTTSELFRRNGWQWTLDEPHGLNISDPTQEVVHKVLNIEGVCWLQCLEGRQICIVNLERILPEAFDELQLPIIVKSPSQISSLALFDRKYNVVTALEPSSHISTDHFILEYQPKICYLAVKFRHSFSLSLGVPSSMISLRMKFRLLILESLNEDVSELTDLLQKTPPNSSNWAILRCKYVDFWKTV